MKTCKKILSMVLALVLVLTLFNCVAFGEEEGEEPVQFTEINSIDDLYMVRNDLAGSYILVNDIDMTEAVAPGGEWDNGQGWLPIGLNSSDYTAFTGVFDGNGHTIKA